MGEIIKNAVADGIILGLKNLGISIITAVANGSYAICLGGAMIALLLYIVGFKKACKWVTLSFIIFFILQTIKVIL